RSCYEYYESCISNPNLFVINHPFTVRNWTNSELFKETNRNASYRTSRRDLGLHHTIVHVVDDQGLEDYQNISIMVMDVPIMVPTGSNPYIPNIGPNNASVEDPYYLNAFAQSYFTDVLLFRWKDELEHFNVETYEEMIVVPESPDINTIVSKNFSVVKNHTITLEGKYEDEFEQEVWTPESAFIVEVHKCLPHRSDVASYPYNNIDTYPDESEDFLGNHTCCDDNYEITSDNICYYFKEYGSYKMTESIGRFKTDPFPDIPDISYTINNLVVIVDESDNDIWMRNFTRICDGNRGNICQGTAKQEVINITGCDDQPLLDERCYGPPIESPNFITEFSTNNPGCAMYDKTTFEAEFQGGTGSCNYTEICSSLGDNKFGTGGDYYCNATCDGAGNCDKTIESLCQDCREDFAAVDPESETLGCKNGDCPTIFSDCKNGKEGVCNNVLGCTKKLILPILQKETCVYDNQNKEWFFKEYYPSNEHTDSANPQIPETCKEKEYNPDDYEEICLNAPGCKDKHFKYDNSWGENKRCCGDDQNEFYKAGPPSQQGACCSNPNQCGYNGECINLNQYREGHLCTNVGWISS
ncbi:MAG: hypothetical protein KKF89_01645, partial [Nanoarchaeota archaeon]|nr:hypothetical protein [Nanoarchaeota archaeon]